MRRRISASIACAMLLAAPASAQQDRADYRRALAAGYKASFLCSDLSNAGLSPDVVEQDDLKRTYPELEPLFESLPAVIDRQLAVFWSAIRKTCRHASRNGVRI